MKRNTRVTAVVAICLTATMSLAACGRSTVKANTPTVIALTNKDATAEEFDSTALKVEKVVAGNSTGNVRIRALAPGRYPFMGEYHSGTAQGVVVAK